MSDTKVITGKVRFSYAHVFEPTSIDENSPKKYSVSIIIPKSDTKTLGKIEAAIDAAIEAGNAKLAGKNGKVVKSTLKLPLRDGDEERPDDAVYADSFFINASSVNKPGLVDENVDPIMNKDDFYSGCYGRASLNFYAFNVQSKGIACGLNNLQKTEDGERLSGGASAESDFGDDSEDDLLG